MHHEEDIHIAVRPDGVETFSGDGKVGSPYTGPHDKLTPLVGNLPWFDHVRPGVNP